MHQNQQQNQLPTLGDGMEETCQKMMPHCLKHGERERGGERETERETERERERERETERERERGRKLLTLSISHPIIESKGENPQLFMRTVRLLWVRVRVEGGGLGTVTAGR